MKKILSRAMSAYILLSALCFPACENGAFSGRYDENVLRVASWDEYIDEGGSYYEEEKKEAEKEGVAYEFGDWYYDLTGIDLTDTKALYEEFEKWYKDEYGKEIKVEYVPLQDNETMYNKIKMGDSYDLLCPSEYMAMKMKAEGYLQPFSEEFFDPTLPNNYYVQNVSKYTESVFKQANLDGYIAGYMWGTTGFVFNPEKIDREVMKSWFCLTSDECERSITAKDNVRDSYFMGLGMYYEQELLDLKQNNPEEYKKVLSSKMNDTQQSTINGVKKLLEKMRSNIYGLETDEGKIEVAMGRLDASYQWSGDGVYILDMAEENDLYLEYSIPESASNIWFDGWVMMDGISEQKQHIAEAFVNFLSQAKNVIRNMYYIGYTSCIAGEDVYKYIDYAYGAEEGDEDTVAYDLSYFFGENHILTTYEERTRRQLFAQYPDVSTIDRLVVMNYFDKETNEKLNRMWHSIK